MYLIVYLFMVYLMILSLVSAIQRLIVGQVIND